MERGSKQNVARAGSACRVQARERAQLLAQRDQLQAGHRLQDRGVSKQRGRRRKEAGRAAYRRASGRSCSPSVDSCTLATAKWSSASALPRPARAVSTSHTLHHLECTRCRSMHTFMLRRGTNSGVQSRAAATAEGLPLLRACLANNV